METNRDDLPLFYIEIDVAMNKMYQVFRGQVGNDLDRDLVFSTFNYIDAARAFVGAVSSIDSSIFQLVDSSEGEGGKKAMIFASRGEFRYNEDANWYDDNNDGA